MEILDAQYLNLDQSFMLYGYFRDVHFFIFPLLCWHLVSCKTGSDDFSNQIENHKS